MEERYGGIKPVTHRLTLSNREDMEVTGVTNVETFDEEEIIMETEQGLLAIRGTELNVKHLNLDQGEVKITGYFIELIYSEQKEPGGARGKGLLERLFK